MGLKLEGCPALFGSREACLDMGPHESLANSFATLEHMGRSEAPLHRDYKEGIPGGANRKLSYRTAEDCPRAGGEGACSD